MDLPLTGVGYRALFLIHALLARNDGFDIRFFAARSRKTPAQAFPFQSGFSRKVIIPFFRRLKTPLWTRFDWPPIEWFCGGVDVAHGLFHDVPAARRAIRLVTIHDLSFFLFPETHTAKTIRVQSALLRNCARRADAFEAVSQSCKNDLIEVLNIPEEKIHVVPGGVCVEEFKDPIDRQALEALKRKLGIRREYFIHLGTVEPRKNLPRLLEAYARLRERYRDCPQVVLVGKAGWKSEHTFETLRTLNLADDVVHMGYATRAEAVLLLKGAAACVYPSLYEGFGLPVLEAMAARTPVITSNAAALTELSGGTCLHVDADSVDSLEGGLCAFLDNRSAAAQRAERAYARAQTLTWNRSAQLLADLYRKLAG